MQWAAWIAPELWPVWCAAQVCSFSSSVTVTPIALVWK